MEIICMTLGYDTDDPASKDTRLGLFYADFNSYMQHREYKRKTTQYKIKLANITIIQVVISPINNYDFLHQTSRKTKTTPIYFIFYITTLYQYRGLGSSIKDVYTKWKEQQGRNNGRQ